MHRRSFLIGAPLAALLGAGGVLDGASPSGDGKSAPKRKPQPWRLCCRLTNYGKYQERGWSHLPSLGIHYVFLSIPAAGQIEAMRQRLLEHHLEPLVLRGALDLSTASGVDASEPQFAACQKLGCRFMFVSPQHPGASKEEACDRLRRAGDIARRYGVTISLETHPDLGTNGSVHLETMKRIDHPNVRVNFDTGNIFFYNRGASAAAELKKIVDYVATLEIKDHSGRFMDWNFPALGKGVVDIPAVLHVLEEHGFDGPVTMEIEGIRGKPWNEIETLAVMADSTAYLRSLATFR